MSTYSTHTDYSPLRLWYAMIGVPMAWVVQFLALWAFAEIGCQMGMNDSSVMGFSLVRFINLVISAVALGIGVGALVNAVTIWRQRGMPDEALDSRGNPAFMSATGLMLGIVFLLAIVMTAAPNLFAIPCA